MLDLNPFNGVAKALMNVWDTIENWDQIPEEQKAAILGSLTADGLIIVVTSAVGAAGVEEEIWVATPIGNDSVVYVRINPRTGEKYVGSTESWNRYIARQGEHDRKLRTKFVYDVLGRAQPGMSQRMLEETWIRRLGGPKKKGGLLANKRYEVNDAE